MFTGLEITLRQTPTLKKIIQTCVYSRLINRPELCLPLPQLIRRSWYIQKKVGHSMSEVDEAKGYRLYRCRPWGSWVTYKNKTLPEVCGLNICPHCLARSIERIYNVAKSLPGKGLTRIWASYDVTKKEARSKLKTSRSEMSYKIGQVYKLPSLIFSRLMRIENRWVVACNMLIPSASCLNYIKIDPIGSNNKYDYIQGKDKALGIFLPRIMGLQTQLFTNNNLLDMLWYLKATSKLHVCRGTLGVTLNDQEENKSKPL